MACAMSCLNLASKSTDQLMLMRLEISKNGPHTYCRVIGANPLNDNVVCILNTEVTLETISMFCLFFD